MKRAYRSKRIALQAINTLTCEHDPLRAYRCPGCRLWHMTSNVQRARASI